MDMSLSKLRDLVIDRKAWHAAVHGIAKSRIWLSDWTELKKLRITKKDLSYPIIYTLAKKTLEITVNFNFTTNQIPYHGISK